MTVTIRAHSSRHTSLALAAVFIAVAVSGCFPSAPRFRTAPAPRTTTSATVAPTPVTSVAVDDRAVEVVEGMASYYADEFNGRKTSSGEIFDMNKMTCAHQTFEFGTKLRVVNLDNGKTCEVIVNDRGPFVADRIIDLSFAAARSIGMIGPGTAHVRLEVLERGVKK